MIRLKGNSGVALDGITIKIKTGTLGLNKGVGTSLFTIKGVSGEIPRKLKDYS